MLGIILNVYESGMVTGSLLETKLPQILGLRVKLANRIIKTEIRKKKQEEKKPTKADEHPRV
jgi:hypothetical protein